MRTAFMLLLGLFVALPLTSHAELYITSAMQRCNAHQDCTLISTQCGQPCGTTPINAKNITSLEAYYRQQCGQGIEDAGICTNQGSFQPACVNNRCTIKQAHQQHGSAGDYKGSSQSYARSTSTPRLCAEE